MKHFEEPLSVLVHDSTLGQSTSGTAYDEDTLPFFDTLLSELAPNTYEADDDTFTPDELAEVWKDASVEGLVKMVDDAREAFYRRATDMRIAYQVFTRVRSALLEQGIKVTMPGVREEIRLEFMSKVARGRTVRDVSHLVMIVKCVQIVT